MKSKAAMTGKYALQRTKNYEGRVKIRIIS